MSTVSSTVSSTGGDGRRPNFSSAGRRREDDDVHRLERNAPILRRVRPDRAQAALGDDARVLGDLIGCTGHVAVRPRAGIERRKVDARQPAHELAF
eukprot:763902-Prymnesium_polylepis.1